MRTSLTHPLLIDGFELGAGVVGMTLCPGRKGHSISGPDWDRDLDADVGRIREWGATVVVTLTEQEEMERLGVGDLGSVVRDAGLKWMHLPIPDTGTPGPAWSDGWHDASPAIHNELENGGRVVIHCKAGLERTAMVAALVQCEHGRDLDTALSVIARTRSGAGPLSNQRRWLQTYLAKADHPSRFTPSNYPTPVAVENVVWVPGKLEFTLSTYVTRQPLPDALVTSARCIVLRDRDVLALTDRDGSRHILPGGRREPGEPIIDTVRRELKEETNIDITHIDQLGVMHFQHLMAKPPGYRYPYPHFLQATFVAIAPESYEVVCNDEWVIAAEFMPVDQVFPSLAKGQRALLEHVCSSSTP